MLLNMRCVLHGPGDPGRDRMSAATCRFSSLLKVVVSYLSDTWQSQISAI